MGFVKRIIGSITGANAAEDAAEAQAKAIQAQTATAQKQAAEASRQAATQAAQAQARNAATAEAERISSADTAALKAPEVSLGSGNDESTQRKRGRFAAPSTAVQSISI